MNTPTALCSITALLAGAFITSMVAAYAPTPQDDREVEFQPYRPHVINVEFEGGTVRDYVAVLRQSGENINITLDRDAGDVTIPAVELRNVMLIDALRILDDLEPVDESFELEVGEFQSGPVELTSAVYRIMSKKQRPPQPPLQTSVWSVSRLLGREIEAAQLLGAIETALSLQQDLGAPEVRFHEETGLILARAHPDQISIIGEVVHNLQATATPDRSTDEAELDALMMRFDQTQAALAAMENRAERAEAMARDMERENERLRVRLEILNEELSRLREGAGGEQDRGG